MPKPLQAHLDDISLVSDAAQAAVLEELSCGIDCATASGCLPPQAAMQVHWLQAEGNCGTQETAVTGLTQKSRERGILGNGRHGAVRAQQSCSQSVLQLSPATPCCAMASEVSWQKCGDEGPARASMDALHGTVTWPRTGCWCHLARHHAWAEACTHRGRTTPWLGRSNLFHWMCMMRRLTCKLAVLIKLQAQPRSTQPAAWERASPGMVPCEGV